MNIENQIRDVGNSYIKVVDLERERISPENIKKISDALLINTSVEELSIAVNTPKDVSVILKALHNNKSLKYLYFHILNKDVFWDNDRDGTLFSDIKNLFSCNFTITSFSVASFYTDHNIREAARNEFLQERVPSMIDDFFETKESTNLYFLRDREMHLQPEHLKLISTIEKFHAGEYFSVLKQLEPPLVFENLHPIINKIRVRALSKAINYQHVMDSLSLISTVSGGALLCVALMVIMKPLVICTAALLVGAGLAGLGNSFFNHRPLIATAFKHLENNPITAMQAAGIN